MKELSSKATAIIEAAQRCETPGAEVRSRVWEQMQLRAAAGDLGPTLSEPASSTSLASTKLIGWIAAAAIGGGAVVAGVGMLGRDGDPVHAPTVHETIHETVEPQEPEEPPAEPAVAPPARPEAVVVPAEAPPAVQPKPSPTRRSKRRAQPKAAETDGSDAASGLAEEVELMGRARAALGQNDATRALALLEEHAKKFPRGTLGPERDASRIVALCALGRTEQAKKHAAAFMRRHPRSALAERVRRTCAGNQLP